MPFCYPILIFSLQFPSWTIVLKIQADYKRRAGQTFNHCSFRSLQSASFLLTPQPLENTLRLTTDMPLLTQAVCAGVRPNFPGITGNMAALPFKTCLKIAFFTMPPPFAPRSHPYSSALFDIVLVFHPDRN